MGHKNQKGTVSITQYNGRIRLRWRKVGKRYSMNLNAYSELNLIQAKKVALQIEQDLVIGTFDQTLSKYTGMEKGSDLSSMSFVGLFEYWVKNCKQMDCEVHTNYNSTRNMIRKWNRVHASSVLKKFNEETNSPVTYNRRLTILKTFVQWLVDENVWANNPLVHVERKKV